MSYKIETIVEVTTTEKQITEVTLEQYVGHQITKAREAKGLTTLEAIEALNNQISSTHLRNIEKGLLTLRLKDMKMLSDFLGLHISELFPAVEPEETL